MNPETQFIEYRKTKGKQILTITPLHVLPIIVSIRDKRLISTWKGFVLLLIRSRLVRQMVGCVDVISILNAIAIGYLGV
jgi:hypothetical protein